jgi:hypothetical protein
MQVASPLVVQRDPRHQLTAIDGDKVRLRGDACTLQACLFGLSFVFTHLVRWSADVNGVASFQII